MNRLGQTRDDYERHAKACLAVLAKTKNPASQAMLTAMAHTWLTLAEAQPAADGCYAEQYKCNAQEALERSSKAEQDSRMMWLQLAGRVLASALRSEAIT